MSSPILSRVVLVLTGLTALFVSLSILFDTRSFYSGYGIELGTSLSLINELKSPSGGMFLVGIGALLGALFSRFALNATMVSTFFYLSYGSSRLTSLAFDGVPGLETLTAMGVEFALGFLCLWSLWAQRAR